MKLKIYILICTLTTLIYLCGCSLLSTVSVNTDTIVAGTEYSVYDLFSTNEENVELSMNPQKIIANSLEPVKVMLNVKNGTRIEAAEFEFNVIDQTPPEVTQINGTITEGEPFDIKNFIEISDNIDSPEAITVNVLSGTVDTSTVGEYKIDVEAVDSSSNSSSGTLTFNVKPKLLTAAELESQLSNQELKIISSKYTVQSEKYKSLYPDMLQVVLKNDTTYEIKNAVVAFVAWDSNNLPVKIKGSIDFSDGSYVKKVNYDDINLIPGGTYGNSSGFSIDEDCGISKFKAIVVSYETFSGETWDNPLFDNWCSVYEDVKLLS